MNNILIITPILMAIISMGCTSNSEQGIKDEREGFMEALGESLEENNIAFRIDEHGFIRYPSESSEVVEKIISTIDYNQTRTIGTKFENKESTAYFRTLLEQRGINYRTEVIKEDDWTYWIPETKNQADALEIMVISFYFEQAKERLAK